MLHSKSMKLLHKNYFGYVAKCKCCKDIQLGLGNVILTFTEQDYFDFGSFFDEIRENYKAIEDKNNFKKKYIISTGYNGVILSLSYKELEYTIELLNFSNIMLFVNSVI